MARYIDADILLEELQRVSDKEGVKADTMANAGVYDASVKYGHGQYCYINAMEIVKDAPTADVVEVKHGKWNVEESKEHFNVVCSSCNKDFYVYKKGQYRIQCSNYCPHCGAKMDGGDTQ